MVQIFEGYSQAINFAQTESNKINRKLYVFLIRTNGVQYAVADELSKDKVNGKLMGEYGKQIAHPHLQKEVFVAPKEVVIPDKKEEVKEGTPIVVKGLSKEVNEITEEPKTEEVKEVDSKEEKEVYE